MVKNPGRARFGSPGSCVPKLSASGDHGMNLSNCRHDVIGFPVRELRIQKYTRKTAQDIDGPWAEAVPY
jgi:hypothetical protein